MRLGFAVLGAAVVIGGYALVDSVALRRAEPAESSTVAPAEAGYRPGPIAEPEPETRSYELIRFVNRDGSFGMVDDPRRVPPGATIVGREKKTVAVAKPAPGLGSAADPFLDSEREEEERLTRMLEERQESSRRLSAIQRRVMEAVLGGGPSGAGNQLGKVQQGLDEMRRETDRMNDCADGDCPERADASAAAADGELRSAVPKPNPAR